MHVIVSTDSKYVPRGLERPWQRRQFPILIAFGLALVLFGVVSIYAHGFAGTNNLRNLVEQSLVLGTAAIGQTVVIITGGIDLSIPAMMGVAAVLLPRLAHNDSGLWKPALVVLGIATALGLFNGVAVGVFGAPAIIVTLGTNSIMLGGLLGATNGGGFSTSSNVTGGLVKTLTTGQVGPFPVALFVWLGEILAITLLLSRTSFGRKIYAIGSNATAARMSGVNQQATLVGAYVISAWTAALAGFLIAGWLGQTYPGIGADYLFTSISVVLIGGASILGGSGHYLGTVAGTMTLVVLGGLLAVLNLGPAFFRITYGVVIFATVGLGMLGNWKR